jgi:hypothetical protein
MFQNILGINVLISYLNFPQKIASLHKRPKLNRTFDIVASTDPQNDPHTSYNSGRWLNQNEYSK